MTRRPAPRSSSSHVAVDVQPQVLEKMGRTKGGDGLAGRSHKSTTPPNGKGRATDLLGTTPPNGKGRATDILARFLEKIQKTKRADDDVTRRSHSSLQKKKYLPVRSVSKHTRDKLNGHSKVHRPIDIDDMTSEYFSDLGFLGYPMPQIGMVADRMILVNTFEETFGDAYPEGVWDEFSKSASSDIDRYVVALASFKGGIRHFACTGFFIEWNGSTTILTSASLVRSFSDENKADEDLRIEVLLPNKLRIEGLLEHYSLHYNVALVGVRDCRVVRPASIQPYRFKCSKVASVGRCFKSGALMATSGNLVSWSGTLDCMYTVRSSCKITKAGIGGPLVDMRDGKVIGMNFYDKRIGTPFLLWEDIDNILAHFAEKSKSSKVGRDECDPRSARFWKMDGDDSDRPSRWPVPEPCWLNPDDLAEDESEDDELEIELPNGRRMRYGYSGGQKVLLL